jgi:hypothetical protein
MPALLQDAFSVSHNGQYPSLSKAICESRKECVLHEKDSKEPGRILTSKIAPTASLRSGGPRITAAQEPAIGRRSR